MQLWGSVFSFPHQERGCTQLTWITAAGTAPLALAAPYGFYVDSA